MLLMVLKYMPDVHAVCRRASDSPLGSMSQLDGAAAVAGASRLSSTRTAASHACTQREPIV